MQLMAFMGQIKRFFPNTISGQLPQTTAYNDLTDPVMLHFVAEGITHLE